MNKKALIATPIIVVLVSLGIASCANVNVNQEKPETTQTSEPYPPENLGSEDGVGIKYKQKAMEEIERLRKLEESNK